MASKTLGVVSLLFLVAAAAFVSTAIADDTTSYTMVPQSKGKPEVARCNAFNLCFNKLLSCPQQCPSRNNTDNGKKACFMDCGTKCETTCKHRKPICTGFGSLCYDPRLVGGDGSLFYFHGEKDQDFCLVSDRNVHINGHFIGLRPEGRSRDYTWVQALGVLFRSHRFSVGAKKVAQWDDEVDQLEFSYDGVPFFLEEAAGALWVSENGELAVERTYQKNVVEVILQKTLSMLIQVVPITAAEDKAHNYRLPSDNVFAHLDLQFKFYSLSSNVNGVLGQTYQPGYVSPAKTGVKMPVLGGEDRFFTNDLFNYDCKASQFSPESQTTEVFETLLPINVQCSSKGVGSGIVCRR